MEDATGRTPPALARRPALEAGSVAVLQAYDMLDQSRQYSELGPQALQMSEILAYMEIARIHDADERLLFLKTMKTLDVIHLNHYAKKLRKSS